MTLSRAGSRSHSEPSTESLAEALTALCAEVGIPFEEMLQTVEGALAVAYTRAFSPVGEVASGVVDRMEMGTVYVDLGRAEGVMPPDEQIPGELLHPGRPVLVVIM